MSRPIAASVLAATMLLAAAAGWRAMQYGLWQDGEPGPGLFPLLACLLAIAATAAVAVELRAGAPAAPADEDDESRPTPGRLAATMGIVIAWGLLLQPLGYALSCGIALLALMRAGGVGLPAAAAISLAAVAATELLFVRLLEVPLPRAAWF